MKQLKNDKNYVTLLKVLSVVLLVVLIVLWQWAAEKGLINMIILPAPSRVYAAFIRMVQDGSLLKHIRISFHRVMVGYVLGAAAGVILGFILGAFRSLEILTSCILGLFRPIPPLALIPMLILWLGIGENSKIAVIALVAFWPTFVNTQEGIHQADNKLLELATVLKKSRFEKICTIILPSALPYVFAGLRLSISRAWGGVVVAEMLAASAGVGFLIQYSRELSKPDMMLVGVITIAVIGYLIDTLLKLLHKRICYWHVNSID
ncbi:MAG: ABC transporter permease [Lachnospiraceae bacterium]|nr:ABC transporter permease [Lachnospiraceae bacterium]